MNSTENPTKLIHVHFPNFVLLTHTHARHVIDSVFLKEKIKAFQPEENKYFPMVFECSFLV